MGIVWAYDGKNDRTLLFGGFDSQHRPLSDIWAFSSATVEQVTTNAGEVVTNSVLGASAWTKLTGFEDLGSPQPRGGASMIFYGDYIYDRAISNYCVSGNAQKIVMYGGTDGKTYFNDTWVYDDSDNRWVLVQPFGEHSLGPAPRAFATMEFAQNIMGEFNSDNDPPCASPAAYLFGGRRGTIPTGKDTDFDYVDDGLEYELGGPAAGRDPRINKLVYKDKTSTETVPYNFQRMSSYPSLVDVYPGLQLGAIANFETLRSRDGVYASLFGLPYERHPDIFSGSFTTPGPTTPVGVDAERPDLVDLWYHRYGLDTPNDIRDVWELGYPLNNLVGISGAPAYAYSGRYCYGTDLDGTYPNNAQMELYSPLFDLLVPSADTVYPNPEDPGVFLGPYFLMFHEWLELADSEDSVRVEIVRPSTPSEITSRATGVGRPIRQILPERNNADNTTGTWRRVIVPLDIVGNETNLYLRFVLQSDAAGRAGGWYIDDVAIFQAGAIAGSSFPPDSTAYLTGQIPNNNLIDTNPVDSGGNYQFGLLPLGNYLVKSEDPGFTSVTVGPGDPEPVASPPIILPFDILITDIEVNSPADVTFDTIPGLVYQIEYTDALIPEFLGQWQFMTFFLATDITDDNYGSKFC